MVKIPTGTYSTVNGLSDQQISRTGLGFQKSQNGGGEVPSAGSADSPYHRFGSRIPAAGQESTFFDGIDITLQGIASLAGDQQHGFLTDGLDKINGLVEKAIHNYSVNDPGAIAPVLADGLTATDQLIEQVNGSALSGQAKYDVLHELNVKHTQFNDALALALGVSLDANVTSDQTKAIPEPVRGFGRMDQPNFPMAIPGQKFRVLVHVADNGSAPIDLDNATLELDGNAIQADSTAGKTSGQIDGGGILNTLFSVQIPDDSGYTKPYFDRPGLDQAYYDVRKPRV